MSFVDTFFDWYEPAWDLVFHDEVPVLLGAQLLHHVGVVTHGVEAADDRAHARSRDVVDRDAGFFYHPQGSDMRETLSAAAAQHHAYLRTMRINRILG